LSKVDRNFLALLQTNVKAFRLFDDPVHLENSASF